MEAPSWRLSAARIAAGFLFIVIGFIFLRYLVGWNWPHAFFDARVLVRAIDQVRTGHSPYDLIHGPRPDLNNLPLVYPPPIGWLVEGVARTPVPLWLVEGMVFVSVVSGMVAGILSSVRLFFEFSTPRVILYVGVFASLLAGSGVIAANTGNISSLFYGLALATSLAGFGKGDWRYFHLVVLLATLFKPYFAALWIIPVLASGWSWRQFWISTAAATAAAAVIGAVAAARPDLTAGWLTAVASRIPVGDVGCGLYGLLHARLGNAIGLAAHTAYMLVLLGMLGISETRGRMRYAALIVIAIAANPRLNSYDFAFANLPAFYIYGSRLEQLARPERGPWLSLLAGLMAASWSILWLPVFTTHYKIWRAEQDLWVILFLGGAVLLATQWRLFEAYFPNRRAVAATAVG